MDQGRIKIFYLKKKVIFPHSNLSVMIKQTKHSDGIKAGDRIIACPLKGMLDLAFYRNKIATVTEVTAVEPRDGSLVLSLKGLKRVKIKKLYSYQHARVEEMEPAINGQLEGLAETIRKKCQELIFLINVNESDMLINLINYLADMDQLTDFVSNYFIIDFKNRYRVFREMDLEKRGRLILSLLIKLVIRVAEKNKLENLNGKKDNR